ncbi:S9 family peptidase [Rhodanobacter glycinis]|uniref:Dipeptidyl aminopeptidase/acylaminoacyl peptidase n=1 Tax=Rhodanobacter glycinis TaxID=582702 RepID=A0A1I4FQ99_9GAMM|nr:prolyl oligopeptidase family serine peptidase [Rhodanobacter glycinis]SFL18781.1 Dipeptidyl aminopeptidase/acylaminoacyl peptidase [Rhodanobacter glycinis]
MRRLLLAGLIAFTVLPAAAMAADAPATAPLTMETIMASPDWIGQAVESPYWSVDGRNLYYALKRDGSSVRDLYRVDPAGGAATKLDPAAMAQADGPAVYDRAHQHAAFVLHGDVFLVDLASGRRVQVTRTPQRESAPQFSADGHALQFRDGNDWYVYDLASGVTSPAAILKFADNPQTKQPDALAAEQLRLFKTLREIKADKDAELARKKALEQADPTRAPLPFWLGDKVAAVDTELSPDGRWMLVITKPAHADDGKAPDVIHYVTDSGYTEVQKARTYVGRNDPAPQSLLLLDLSAHKIWPLKTDGLPGIKDDPLKAIRAQTVAALEKAGKDDQAKALKAPAVRPVTMANEGSGGGIVWSDDGHEAAVQLRAIDNKDRWIATVDFNKHALVTQDHLHDHAWINWSFNDFGWLKDGRTLWYLSEASGWSRLYTKSLDGKAREIAGGSKFEVSQPQLSADGKWFYLLANKVAPYSYDVYRVPSDGGTLTRLTQYQGVDGFALSPNGQQLAVLHSAPYMFDQLAVQNAAGGTPRELTNTMKPGFTARHWIEPKFVEVPSSHGAGAIYAKYYGPANETDAPASRPAVIFIHGAGYLQDVSMQETYYIHEQMFHNLLVQQGYVVLDMDYRGSAGYGRDWRDAIYRNMGHPELEDLLDGKAWLVKHHGVDPKRVGVYGGSYGGFMTEMAILRAPGQFAAGAALRAPADWMTYNHEYTANILNDPQLDPEAYKTSSPIEYAANLQDPLLIEHGLIDDNVMASDSIRLYQRFVELHKKNFWISLYPLERHGFKHADDWYDEYRRIDELFNTYVKPVH